MHAHPDVLEAAVVGIPHGTLGEEVAALVVGRPRGRPRARTQSARMRATAWPLTSIRDGSLLVELLPKGPTGKILKREIDVQALLESESST